MKKIILLLSNNMEKDPFLHSQLLDLYLGNSNFDDSYVFCGGASEKSINSFKIINNGADIKYPWRFIYYYFYIFKILFKHRGDSITVHIRGFVSGFLYYLIPKFYFKELRYIYDPRGAFLIERKELGTKNIVTERLFRIEKKLIRKSRFTIVTTEKFKNLFIDYYGDSNKYLVCYNSSSFNYVPHVLSIKDVEVINICYCGTINHWHNLDEITRLIKYLYSLFEKKVNIYFFSNKKFKAEIIEKLKPIDERNISVDFVPYKDLENVLIKMHICISVVLPTTSTKIASPIKISDYIMLNKHFILNKEIGDFDEFYSENNSALLFDYDQEFTFSKNDIYSLNPERNKYLAEKLNVKENRRKIFNALLL